MLKLIMILLLAWQTSGNVISPSGSINSEDIKIAPAASYDKPKKWWEHANFYQLYPRSFKDSNSDGIGDLPGMIEKLDHLKDLGITAAWLSPVMKSPQRDLGYDISDYYDIAPEYGNLTHFEALVKKCHDLGIKLLLDFIPNHTSDQHEWFIKSAKGDPEYKDYYVWRGCNEEPEPTAEPTPEPTDEPTVEEPEPTDEEPEGGEKLDDEEEPAPCKPPNNWISVFGGPAWTWNKDRQQFYLHQFTKYQPDLNYRNPKVVEEMTAVMKFYLDMGVDGFRLDAINHMFEHESFADEGPSGYCNEGDYCSLNHNLTKDLDETFDQVYEWREFLDDYTKEQNTDDKILFTEAYTLNMYNTMRFYRNETFEKLGAHMPFNFELIYAFDDPNRNARELKGSLDYWFNNVPAGFTSNWVVGSHDHRRIATRFGSQRIETANAIMFFLPGTSVSYYGEECGMLDNEKIREEGEKPGGSWKYDNRDPNRTPMQWDDTANAGFSDGKAEDMWLAIPDNYKDLNLAKMKQDEKSIYYQIKELTALRKEKTMMYGETNIRVINDDVIAISRNLINHDTYVLVANLQQKKYDVDLTLSFATLPDQVEVIFKTKASQYSKKQMVDTNKVTVEPFNTVILRYPNSAATLGLSVGIVLLAVLRQFFM